jgi:hypothetical protein
MKFNDNHFEAYVESATANPLHPKLKTIYANAFPSHINQLRNLIFYGPQGTGKYSQALACISRYSPTRLKYEKRLTVMCNKETYFVKISDIHFEIDMSLLGCTSKLLWNEIHNQIVDVISARSDPVGIVLCKNFHNIHSELLETFYNYMHMPQHSHISLKYIMITEHVGFIPINILNSCELVPVARPTAAMYKKTLAIAPLVKIIPENITNIKSLQNCEHKMAATTAATGAAATATTTAATAAAATTANPHQELFNNLCEYIINVDQIRFAQLRELLYDIMIYDFDITECAWHLITELKRKGLLRDADMSHVMINTYKFLQYYNNNYRPISHLENFVFMLVNIICQNGPVHVSQML